MNNIEILEKIIQGDKDCMKSIASNTDNYESDEDYKYFKREVQALENILKERKTDKERIKNSIPKSIVREKIEYCKQIVDNGANSARFAMTKEDEIERIERQKNINTMIAILQELLEEE